MKTARRRSRELAVQAVYQSLINRTAAPEIAKNIREMSDFAKADEELFNKLFFGTQTNAADYIQKIRPLLDRDEKDLNPIERAVLLTACHELSAMPETPYPVIINEAIEVTKPSAARTGTNSSTASSTNSPPKSAQTSPNAVDTRKIRIGKYTNAV
ncbi:transcription antitermination protein NusB [Neisseria gonorrhoeae]|uniref:Transcription antitermination protein NusB n=1 Tax=Neisseria gonorrhoeae TaxID=485 RepID=A0A378W204_NEIGO|nr:transcription antitermination protein NusB [Neisseria gonorrhoeae]